MNAANIVAQYCDDVLSGKLVAGELQRAAVRRYVDDLKRAKSGTCGFYFDQQKAEFAVAFIQLLPLTESEFNGKPFILSPWQVFIVWNLWGWRRTVDGHRRFRQAWIEIARKNGKSEFAAAISCLLFHADGEAKPDCYCAATKQEQAGIVFDKAVAMTQARPFLSRRCKYLESKARLKRPDGGVLRPLGSEGKSADGLSPHGVFFDELHEWKAAKHLKLWEKLTTGSGIRPQPLFVVITTAGDDQSELWKRERSYSVRVVLGEVVDDSHFSFICCIDDDDDPFDRDNWIKANPNLGVSVRWDYLEELARKAAELPEALNAFRRYHCNQRVESLSRAIPDRLWKAGAKPLPVLSGRIAYGGIDIGFRDDLAAFGLVFPPLREGEPWAIKCRSFLPADCRRDLTAEPFRTWISDGLLTITPGNTTDADAIYSAVAEARELYNLKSIAIDPNNARILGSELVARGCHVYEFSQWARTWNEPFREILRLFAERQVIHGDDPVLSWCATNLVTHTSGDGLIKPSKQSSREKIDPLVAVFFAFAEALFHEVRETKDGQRPQIRMM